MNDRFDTDDRFTGDPSADRDWLTAVLGEGNVARIEDEVSRWRDSLVARDNEALERELYGLSITHPRTARVTEVVNNRFAAVCTVLQERGVDLA